MPAPLLIPTHAHFDFTALPSIRTMESLAHAGQVFAGVQNGLWQYDEHYWSERKGAWAGVIPMPAREVVGDLRVLDAARETFNPNGFPEPLDRVASGAPLVARGITLYRANYYGMGVPEGVADARLYSCATGAMVAQSGADGALGIVPDGAYLLWARTFAGAVFETPFGPARIKDGEWSALRVVVGDGEWSVAAGVCPSPGAALYAKNDDETEAIVTPANAAQYRVVFDPLARAVSASCELTQSLRTNDGQFIAPAGALLIGGLRASENGPQSALWLLRADGTAKLLGLQTSFTDGVCECAKTNHFCSDLVQAPDGTLYFLTECALFRYDPDAPDVREALPGYPDRSHGHPGGNCLRFPSANEMIFWTENFGGVSDGTAHYNRMVRRVGGRDLSGPSTLWHGTNCAELYLGRYWAVRSDEPETLYLDWMESGRWQGFAGMKRPTATHFWQRLRAVGSRLYLWGYAPGDGQAPPDEPAHAPSEQKPEDAPDAVDEAPGASEGARPHVNDAPICAVADGRTLRDAAFPYFIRRATVCNAGEDARLFVTARDGDDGIGPANRVVEILNAGGGGTHICSFWNEELESFTLSRAEFEAAGGDVAKLAAYFVWIEQAGRDGGGVWRASATMPTTGFWLSLFVNPTTMFFNARPNGTLPYDPNLFWGKLCFDILSDGSVEGPFIEPACGNAQCVIDSLPDGSGFRCLERMTPDAAAPMSAFQINDTSDEKRLSDERDAYPCLWYRINSDASRGDLTTYTHLAHYGRLIVPATPATARIEAVVLVTPTNQPVRLDELPELMRRA